MAERWASAAGLQRSMENERGDFVARLFDRPDSEVLIGEDFKPPYDWMKGKDLGMKSWPPDKWQIGGGTVWGWISYDPDLKLIYYGTSNPGTWNHDLRPGDNLWSSAVFARDPNAGKAKWAYQMGPHDLWDYDEINENILLDLNIDNHFERFSSIPAAEQLHVMDRATGEVISADPYDTVNSIRSIDLKTGRPVLNEALADGRQDSAERMPRVTRRKGLAARGVVATHQVAVCAASTSVHELPDWRSRVHRWHTLCRRDGRHVCRPRGTPRRVYGLGSVSSKKCSAMITEKFPVWTGALVTAGDLAFYGTMDRWFKAVDAQSGKELWKFHADSGFIGQPVTFMGNEGVQYVAIMSGVGGWAGAVAAANIDPQVRNGALGFTGAMGDLPRSAAPETACSSSRSASPGDVRHSGAI